MRLSEYNKRDIIISALSDYKREELNNLIKRVDLLNYRFVLNLIDSPKIKKRIELFDRYKSIIDKYPNTLVTEGQTLLSKYSTGAIYITGSNIEVNIPYFPNGKGESYYDYFTIDTIRFPFDLEKNYIHFINFFNTISVIPSIFIVDRKGLVVYDISNLKKDERVLDNGDVYFKFYQRTIKEVDDCSSNLNKIWKERDKAILDFSFDIFRYWFRIMETVNSSTTDDSLSEKDPSLISFIKESIEKEKGL